MWFYIESGEQKGPVSQADFDELVRGGRVKAMTLVWREGMPEWETYGRLTGAAISNESAIDLVQCFECRRSFAHDEVLNFQNTWVCSACKPLFFQRLKEGVPLPGLLVYAGFWVRFFAKLIDGVIVWIVEMAILIGLGAFLGVTMGGFSQNQPPLAFFLVFYPIIFGVSLGYSIWFLGKFGATPGKMALGLKVVTSTGEPINYTKALTRSFAEILSALACYVGYFMVAFDEQKKALHDQICDTRVIRK